MKKRLFLVNYGFTLAGHEYSEYKLVSIKYEGTLDEEWGRQLAEAQVSTWFEQFTDCTPTKFIASTALEASYPQRKTQDRDIQSGWFTNEMKPSIDPSIDDEDGAISDDVLIDVNGKRETFVTGCWHFPHEGEDGWWRVDEDYKNSLEPDNMRWSYLPLVKYEKR